MFTMLFLGFGAFVKVWLEFFRSVDGSGVLKESIVLRLGVLN